MGLLYRALPSDIQDRFFVDIPKTVLEFGDKLKRNFSSIQEWLKAAFLAQDVRAAQNPVPTQWAMQIEALGKHLEESFKRKFEDIEQNNRQKMKTEI